MLTNYCRVAFRNLSKNKVFTFIHILGLALGTAICALIFKYVTFESSFDDFHTDVEQIYRVPIRYSEGFSTFPKTAANHSAMGPAMKLEFPEVLEFIRILKPSNVGIQTHLISINDQNESTVFKEENLLLTDSLFFNFFSYKFIIGDPKNCLNRPNTIVLTESLAAKYFGDVDPINKVIYLNSERGQPMTVTAVIEDLPGNTHLNFDGLISFYTIWDNMRNVESWIWPEFHTYVKLNENSSPEELEAKFPSFTKKYLGDIHQKHNFKTYFSLQPLEDIHLKSDCANELSPTGSQNTVNFLTILGIFIMIIAWVNYINISTAKSLDRSKEVGIRKVAGADKHQLVNQFLIESILINTVSIILGLVAASFFLPYFKGIIGVNIGNVLLEWSSFLNPLIWVLFIFLILISGIISGIYPAFILSSFKPISALKGKSKMSLGLLSLRKVLVGFQFAISLVLIAATILVTRQLQFMSNKDLGYKKEAVLILEAPLINDSSSWLKSVALVDKLNTLPDIATIAKSADIPGKMIDVRVEARRISENGTEYNATALLNIVDYNFNKTFGVTILAGRDFVKSDSSNVFNSNSNNKIIINKALAIASGFSNPDDAIGEEIRFKYGPEDRKATIIGVANNYHQRSPKEQIDKILYYYPSYPNWAYFSMKVEGGDWLVSLSKIESVYKEVFPNFSFNYFFLDEYFDSQFRAEQQFSRVCNFIAVLAIFVACLGFFGLSTLTLAQKTKEISIRKVLGAEMKSIFLLLTKEFIILLVICNIIVIPILYILGQKWLDNFAYNGGMGLTMFIMPALILLSIMLSIVLYQLARTSLNPIKHLKGD